MSLQNPSAFPWYFPADGRVGSAAETGMTLRDYFAGQALAGWVSDPGVGAADAAQRQNLAEICYAIADAMLEARKP